MRHFFIVILTTCSCFLQGQVWTNLIDSIPNQGWAHFVTSVVDSSSNTLYLGGQFYRFNQYNTNCIIKYNGSSFDTLQSGLDDYDTELPQVINLTMFQNKLYVGGNFKKTGKYWCKNLGRWNGASWDTVNFSPNGSVWFLKVYNDELYVAGNFTNIGGIAANYIAKFDGANWYSLNFPPYGCITGMNVFRGKIFVSSMVSASSSCANLSYYDGSNWISWVGVSGDNNKGVEGISVIDSMMYVYGRFDNIAGTNCKGLAAYNGKSWYAIGSGLSNSNWETIYDVKKINNDIYIYGHFNTIEGLSTGTINANPMYTNIVKFDGQKLCTFSPPFGYDVHGMVGYNGNLYAHGSFRKIGNDSVWGFVRWNGGNTTISCSPTIALIPSAIGINELTEFYDLKIYPNPAKDKLYIASSGFNFQGFELDIINSLGQVVYTKKSLVDHFEIDLGEFPEGIYFVKIRINSDQKVFKIIKE